jgi:hypothetical protein
MEAERRDQRQPQYEQQGQVKYEQQGQVKYQGDKEAFFIVAANAGQLREISELIETGVLRPVVREVLPIAAAAPSILAHEDKGPR